MRQQDITSRDRGGWVGRAVGGGGMFAFTRLSGSKSRVVHYYRGRKEEAGRGGLCCAGVVACWPGVTPIRWGMKTNNKYTEFRFEPLEIPACQDGLRLSLA